MSSNRLNSVLNIEEETPFKPVGEKHEQSVASTITKATIGKSILRRFHILSWIREYDRNKAVADLIAGITLGMTMIPQSIAYASLAGLSSQYGLYSAFVGSFVYVIFGTIPQVSIGPTSLMALLTLQFTKDLPVQFAIMLAFMSGIAELAMGLFNLGFVVNFISQPVTSAFTTGTSAIVILVQLKGLMGVRVEHFSFGAHFLDQLSIGDSVLGLTCMGVLLSLRQLSRVEFSTTSTFRSFLKRFLWYISISRNAIVVFGSSLVAYHLVNKDGSDFMPFALSKKVNSTTPSIQFPPFTIMHENTTYFFVDICKELGSGLFVVPIVAVLANVAIAKAFVKDSSLDASQEMLTLGVCNIAGSFFNAMPTCGAFTRSAVSQASGVKTPMTGMYTGVLVLLALGVLTPYFEYIPKSALSAVLISAVFFMLDFSILKDLWKTNKTDFFNWIGVFIVCVFGGVELGLLFGIVVNMVCIAIRLGNPKIKAIVKNVNGHYFIHIVPCTDIYYAGADELRNKIKSMCIESNYEYPIVIDCNKLTESDYTLLQTLKCILKELQEKNVKLYLQTLNLKTKELLLLHFDSKAFTCCEDSDLGKVFVNKNR